MVQLVEDTFAVFLASALPSELAMQVHVKNTFIETKATESDDESTVELRRTNSAPASLHSDEQASSVGFAEQLIEVAKPDILEAAAIEAIAAKRGLRSSPATCSNDERGSKESKKPTSGSGQLRQVGRHAMLSAAMSGAKSALKNQFMQEHTLDQVSKDAERPNFGFGQKDVERPNIGFGQLSQNGGKKPKQRLTKISQEPPQFDNRTTCGECEVSKNSQGVVQTSGPWQVPPPPLALAWQTDKSVTSPACPADCSQLPSRGSFGHPFRCRAPCKYAFRRSGCRNGYECVCCHLCKWTRRNDGLLGYERFLLDAVEDFEGGN